MIKKRTKLYYNRNGNNFGDMLSPILVGYMAKEEQRFTSYITNGKLLAIGSILKALKENDIVWGTGSMYDQEIISPPNVEWLAVRGPLTRNLIDAEVPNVYGDPALLMPKFYTPKKINGNIKYRIGIAPHTIDYYLFKDLHSPNINVIDLTMPPLKVIDELNKCETIISTSLHGIIVSEAYNIPCTWLRVSDNIKGGNFKFNDYLLSTGRQATEPVDYRKTLNSVNIYRIAKETLDKPIINTDALEKAFYRRFNR